MGWIDVYFLTGQRPWSLFRQGFGSANDFNKKNLVDHSSILEGQRTTLYTAIGQPFEAKPALVKLDTPYYKGYVQVGLVPSLVADALLRNDVISKRCANVVTRLKAFEEVKDEVLL